MRRFLFRWTPLRLTVILLQLTLAMSGASPAAADEPCPPMAGKQIACEEKVQVDGEEKTIRYWMFAPAALNKQEKWPLMLFLHGAGERGDDLDAVKVWGPPKRVAEHTDFPFLLVSPQCPANERWDVELLAAWVEKLSERLPIDPDRRYITGLSMGGYGTWGLLGSHAELFAAAVPICGGGDPESAKNMVGVPIWAFHGDKDTSVCLLYSEQMVEAVKQAGGSAKLTIYPGVGHNSWSETYANPAVYEWLLSHKKK